MDPRRSDQLHSRQAKDEPIRRFFKLIRDAQIEQHLLRLPSKFVKKYRINLSDTVKLKAPDGRVWKVGLERIGEDIWLRNGFHEFASYYSLGNGHVLNFKYTGFPDFKVHIYNLSCCEISYSPENVTHISDSPPRPSTSTSTSRSRKNVPNNAEPCRYSNVNGVLSPSHFRSRKPHFDVKLRKNNFTHCIVYVPTKFQKKHFPGPIANRESVELELGDGRKWNVAIKQKECGRLNFGGGWKAFQEENRLKENDVCIFELVKKNVFKVHLFLAS